MKYHEGEKTMLPHKLAPADWLYLSDFASRISERLAEAGKRE